jgi:TolB-like protein/Flp pilus assembly protein TadD
MQSDVFISHSSKDQATAGTICNHLESAGVKCWISPRDIEAGSDWTKGIMRGLAGCRVLVVVFTAHANHSEHVGREVAKAFSMGLAVIPFRLDAIKPGENLGYFLETVQWLDATGPPLQKHLGSLTERVKELLAEDEQSVAGVTGVTPDTKTLPIRSKSLKRQNWIVRAGPVCAVFLIAAAVWFFTVQDRAVHQTAPAGEVTDISAKGIAVLPFENISANKDDAYFADGVQHEILNNLAKIAQLKVISRTSVMQYRADVKRDLRQIANALGVANVLEGTVRRDGNHVRVSTELVDARDDRTIWADSYDRDLTDIFAIQSEVAQTIAYKLTTTLSPEEKKSIEAKPTDNLEAYDLYLRAKELFSSARVSFTGENVETPLRDAIGLLEQAVRLDPKFTLAYCAAAETHDFLFLSFDRTPERRALGDAAVNISLRLQPSLAEVHLAYAHHLYHGFRDYERARVQLAIARRGLSNNVAASLLEAHMDRRRGNWEKAIGEFNQVSTLDPRNPISISELASTLAQMRHFRAAEQAYDRLIALLPDQPMLKVLKAMDVSYSKTGDDTAFWSTIAALPASMADHKGVLSFRLAFALVDRDWPQANELIDKLKGAEDEGNFAYGADMVPIGCYSILLARLQGEHTGADSRFAEAREQLNQKLQKSSGNARLLSQLAVVDALLENKEAAISEAKRAVEMLPISKDAVEGPGIAENLAVVYAWAHELDLAFETLGPLTKTPNGVCYGDLKLDPTWDPLHEDPRFEKLLAELAPKD